MSYHRTRRHAHRARGGGNRPGGIRLIFSHDFATDKVLTGQVGPAVVLTRASDNGTYYDSSGDIQTAATNAARFDHDPSDNTSLGLLIEGARESSIFQSEDYETTWGAPANSTITANAGTSPDGANNATDLEHHDSTEKLRQTGVVIDADSVYVLSNFIHSGTTGTHDWIRIDYSDDIGETKGIRAWFDLTDSGAVGVSQAYGAGTILSGTFTKDIGGGWFRVSVAGQQASGETTGRPILANAISDGSNSEEDTNSAWYWGTVVEKGAFPSSYIKTTTAAVTRAADVASADISSIVTAAGTLYFAGRTGLGAGVLVQLDDGTENDRIRFERNASDEIHVIITDGGVEQADLTLGTVADETDFKAIVSYDTNDVKGVLDAGTEQTDTGASMPTTTTLRPGMDTANDEMFATSAQIRMWDGPQPSTFLQTETT